MLRSARPATTEVKRRGSKWSGSRKVASVSVPPVRGASDSLLALVGATGADAGLRHAAATAREPIPATADHAPRSRRRRSVARPTTLLKPSALLLTWSLRL